MLIYAVIVTQTKRKTGTILTFHMYSFFPNSWWILSDLSVTFSIEGKVAVNRLQKVILGLVSRSQRDNRHGCRASLTYLMSLEDTCAWLDRFHFTKDMDALLEEVHPVGCCIVMDVVSFSTLWRNRAPISTERIVFWGRRKLDEWEKIASVSNHLTLIQLAFETCLLFSRSECWVMNSFSR